MRLIRSLAAFQLYLEFAKPKYRNEKKIVFEP